MRPVLSRDQIRAFDREWIARGVPGVVLMENAGRGAAHLIGLKARPRPRAEAPRTGSSVVGSCIRCADERSLDRLRFLVLTGPGNNGGDGFVVARHLALRAAEVRIITWTPPERLNGDASIAYDAMHALGLEGEPLPPRAEWPSLFEDADLVVDALLGTGVDRPVEGELGDFIAALNESTVPVISLDVPSGLDADRGTALGKCVKARHTVTFAHLKRGLLTTDGHAFGGTLTVCHIGVPSQLPFSDAPAAWLLEESDVAARISAREPVTHKGGAGRVVVVAGSPGTVGAARLASRACLRAGAGLVTVCADADTAHQLQEDTVEVMTRDWQLENSAAEESVPPEVANGEGGNLRALLASTDSVVIGPGMGLGPAAQKALLLALRANKPLVVDADGLRILSEWAPVDDHPDDAFTQLFDKAVLTPHPGEAGRLLGKHIQEVEADRFLSAQELSERFQATVVLKGSRTIIAAPGKTPVVSAFGTPALATGGSGDVLSGILGALLVRADTRDVVFERAQTAVALHGIAAELWSQAHGDRGLLASEIGDLLPEVLRKFTGVD